MVRKYIRKLHEKAVEAVEEKDKLLQTDDKKDMEEKASLGEGQIEEGSSLGADSIAKLQDDKPPDLQALSQIAETATFIKFGDLPLELRLKIWKDALPARRILRINGPDTVIRGIDLIKGNSDGLSEFRKLPKYGLVFSTTDVNIGMLTACWESRRVAVKAYPIHLPSEDSSKEIRVGSDDMVVIGNIQRVLEMVGEVTNWDPATFDKFTALHGVHTLAFVAITEDNRASMHLVAKQLIAILTSRIVFMPLFPNVKAIQVICDHTDFTRGGSLEGFVTTELSEHDDGRCSLVQSAKYEQGCYEDVRDIWKKRVNVSFPPLEVMVRKEYL